MTHPFRFSTAMPRLDQPVGAWRDQLRRIEDLGYWSVAVSDHFTRGWTMEPVVAMSVAAEATSRLRMLPLVLGNDYRHPVLLHKSLATLDVLSEGRVEIGLGAGWMPSDYEAAGIPLDPAPARIDRLEESVRVIKGLFGPDPLTYAGEHYTITGLDGLPKPVQTPHPPILVGGGGRRVLELAGSLADVVGITATMRAGAAAGLSLADLTDDRVKVKVAMARDAAVVAGRNPDALSFQIGIQSMHLVDAPGNGRWVTSLARDITDPGVLEHSPAVLHGTVAACVESLQQRREELGIDYVHIAGDPAAAAPLVAALAGT